MKIEINESFKEKYLNFISSLSKESEFEYYPVKNGYTKDGKNINLGFSCFAIKSLYILDVWNEKDLKNQKKWFKYLKSFQVENNNFPSGSFIDSEYLKSINQFSIKKEFKRNVKKVITQNKQGKSKQDEINEFITAESKQAISTLHQVGSKNDIKYKNQFFENNKVSIYLNSLDWSKPWNAGAQFAALCVFLETQEKESKNYQVLKEELIKFLNTVHEKESGAYFKNGMPDQTEIVNGAMKVITGLDWLDVPIHEPNKLIDLCLNIKLDGYGCDIVDTIYVLYKCSLNNSYRRKDIELYFRNVDEIISKHYFPDQGGFSYFLNKSQLYYYGLNITKGLNEPDIHGSILLLWALSLMSDFRKDSGIKLNILKP